MRYIGSEKNIFFLHASFTVIKNKYTKKCWLLFLHNLLIIFSHSFSQIDINKMNLISNREPNINQFLQIYGHTRHPIVLEM